MFYCLVESDHVTYNKKVESKTDIQTYYASRDMLYNCTRDKFYEVYVVQTIDILNQDFLGL